MIGIHTKELLLSKTRTGINLLCILFTVNLLSLHFGFSTFSLTHLISVYLILGILLLNLPLRRTFHSLLTKTPQRRRMILGFILCLVGFLLLIVSNTHLLWISSLSVFLIGLHYTLQTLHHQRDELRLLALTSFMYSLVFLIMQTIPIIWYLYQQTSLTATSGCGTIIGTPQALGPTASGLGFLLVSLLFIICVFILTTRKTKREILRFGLYITSLVLLWFIYLILLSIISYTSDEALYLHFFFFILSLLPCVLSLFCYRNTESAPTLNPPKRRLRSLLKTGEVWAAIFIFIAATLSTLIILPEDSPDNPQKILFYGSNMVGSWDVPEYGKYGKDAVGMFGLWPVYLSTIGYQTELLVQNKTQFLNLLRPPNQNITTYLNLTDYTTVTETEKITTHLLDGTTIFVVSNLNVSFSNEEQTLIWQYVHDGGSLLVVGDHTNVGGIQAPLNELLRPVGIQYRFDAALPLDEHFKWLTCIHPLYHPITIPVTSIDELQYGVGASLDISTPAFPIIIGASGLSDDGNQSNQDIAYLGDYEYNKGEHLGDIVLVAGAYYGRGKVLVFGDTSSFQNPALPFSYSFVHSTFTWLSHSQNSTITLSQNLSALLFLLGAIIVYFLMKNKAFFIPLSPLLLCASLLITTSATPLLMESDESNLTGNLICIDASHGERFAIESFTDESVNGLIVNLQRNNLLPILLREFSKEKISASKLVLFNAPTKTFTADEVAFLHTYMQNGGIVILATGYDDKSASLPLLKQYGVDIEPTPLGPVPYVEENLTLYQNEPRFVDSWPVSFQEDTARSYYNFTWQNLSFHLAVFVKQGNGGLLVISDSQYLYDKNIESIYDYWPGNILFLRYLLDELPLTEAQP